MDNGGIDLGDIRINKLPVPTWNWLKVNEKTVAVPSNVVAAVAEVETLPEEVSVLAGVSDLAVYGLDSVELGAGEEYKEFVNGTGVGVAIYSVAGGVKASEPIRVTVNLSEQADAGEINRMVFELGDDAELTAVVTFKGKSSFAANDIRIKAGKNAVLNLVEIFQQDAETGFVDSIGGVYDETAGLNLIQLVTNDGDLSLGCTSELEGAKSYLNIETGYLVKNQDTLDINYVARHKGENTDSKINVSGVLRNDAKKIFRGTIDFINGCAGAKGDEREDVLLMDDGVSNSTVPLILCAEEDVEGTHGASIGKISEEVLLYFMSRGIKEADINELMAQSRIDAVAGRIPDEKTRQLLLAE